MAAAAALWCASCARPLATPTVEDEYEEPPPSSEEKAKVLFDQPSPYGRVIVVDTDQRRCLKFSMEGGDQSCKDLHVPSRVVHEYARFLSVGLVFTPPSPRTLMIGLGGGSAVRMFLAQDAQMQMDVVEINPVVVRVAREYFDVVPSERLRIHVADGRSFFDDRDDRWDMVVLDAFGNDFIPFHLTTKQFLQVVAEHVTEQGAVVANLWTRNDRLFRAMVKTYTQVFPTVFIFRAVRAGNAIVVSTRREAPTNCQQIQDKARSQAPKVRFAFSYTLPPSRCEAVGTLELEDVPIITDENQREFDELGRL